tara:strand:+ start:83 stop:280 length:198 start_codon:yes stop_codon:yes gene_type:complete
MRIIDEINLVEYMYKEQFQQGIRPVAVFLGENDVCNGCSPTNIYKTVAERRLLFSKKISTKQVVF